MHKKPQTANRIAENHRLAAIYAEKERQLGLTHILLAEALSISQGAVSHYLNGDNALTSKVASVFADLLQVEVADFSPRLALKVTEMAKSAALAPAEQAVSALPLLPHRHDRIAWAIERSGRSKSAIAAACHVSPPSVSQWLSGVTTSLKPENLFALADATGVCARWLAVGEPGEGTHIIRAHPGQNFVYIPELTTEEQAEESQRGHRGECFRKDWLARHDLIEGDLAIVYVCHESLLVHRSHRTPESGGTYVIRAPGNTFTVRQLFQQISGSWLLRCDERCQPTAPDEVIGHADLARLSIVGRVVWRGSMV
jgi:predicted transcriptional regulator